MQGYPDERLAPVKRQNVDNGPVVPVPAPALCVYRLCGVAYQMIFNLYCNYLWYRDVVYCDESLPSSVPADASDDLDDIFVQDALWKGDGGYSFTADDSSVNATSLVRISKTVTTSSFEYTDLVQGLVDEL